MRADGVGMGVLIATMGAAVCMHAGAVTLRPTGQAAAGTAQDCAADYGGKPATCVRVACDAHYHSFLGTWRGKFHAYVRQQSTPGHAVFRPYDQLVTYRVDDCLRNAANGDVFIVGHETDRYSAFGKLPAKFEKNLLITGRHADGTPFFRTVLKDGAYDFKLVFQDEAASLSIWRLHLPASNGQPEETFTTIDGRDFNASSENRRDVTVTMQVGPDKTPYWHGVFVYGWHARQG